MERSHPNGAEKAPAEKVEGARKPDAAALKGAPTTAGAGGTHPVGRRVLGLQRSAGNAAVARLIASRRPVQRSVSIGPADTREENGKDVGGAAPEEQAARQQPAQVPEVASPQGGEPGGGGDASGGGAGGGAAASGGAGGDGQAGAAPEGRPGTNGSSTPPAAGDAGDESGGESGGDESAPPTGEEVRRAPAAVKATALDEKTAAQVADLSKEFGPDAEDKGGKAHPLLNPGMRQAAAALLPERSRDLGLPAREGVQRAAEADAVVQRSDLAVQRKGAIPTLKVKVTLPNWPKTPLFEDKKMGSWFLMSGEIESPKWEGEATPPPDLHDDTKEAELQLTADGKIKGWSSTFHKETLAKCDDTKLNTKVGVEVTDKAVKLSGFELEMPKFGPTGTFAKDKLEFDILEWEKGSPPALMVLSYTWEPKIEANTTIDGWAFKGTASLPIKFSIKPDPLKVADFVVRVLGPRLAAAAPAALAIGAPLAAGAVCFALWKNAVEAGQDFNTALKFATENTKGYVVAFVGTIYEHPPGKWNNAGSAAGAADAKKVLDGLRWSELPEGARNEMREKFLAEGTLKVDAAQTAMWAKFRDQALDWYRQNHSIDAWCYDHGLPSDLGKLGRLMKLAGPPWPISNY